MVLFFACHLSPLSAVLYASGDRSDGASHLVAHCCTFSLSLSLASSHAFAAGVEEGEKYGVFG